MFDRDELFSLLEHQITVVCNKYQKSGFLVCVDPISLTLVLYDNVQQNFSMIFHHSITAINKIEEQDEKIKTDIDFKQICKEFFGITDVAPKYSESEVQQRRVRVLELLKENYVPVEEQDGLLIAAYTVCITPPYTEAECKSSNALVLSRIQNILRKSYSEPTNHPS